MARGARTGKPASIRDPIKISAAMAIKSAKTGLSKAATAIDHMAQIRMLLTPSPRADTDFACLACRRSAIRPTLTLAERQLRTVRGALARLPPEALPPGAAKACDAATSPSRRRSRK